MQKSVVILLVLIFTQLLPLAKSSVSFSYNPLPDLVKVRRTVDAKGAEFFVLDTIGLVEEQGRKVEQHNVTTEDSYILGVFRIPPNPASITKTRKNPVVFLQHGLAASSDCFVIFGPGRSLAYELSDAGYDVWLGNFRGNCYGRAHKTLSLDDSKFWDFSMDEFGLYDLAAMIDYILLKTEVSKLTYIGHSLGSTTILMLQSGRPEYNDKLNLVVHFAPVSYWVTKNISRMLLNVVGKILQDMIDPTGHNELFPQSSLMPVLFKRVCLGKNIVELCYLPLDIYFGADREQSDEKFISKYVGYWPAGASTKSFYHYFQHIGSGKFCKFDYGHPEENMKHYGLPTPPDYDVGNARVDSLIFHAPNDPLSTVEDTKALIYRLPRNITIMYETVPFKNFNHLDFVAAREVKKLVYDRLIKILDQRFKDRFNQNNKID